MSPCTFKVRNDASPASNALAMMYIMKMMSAEATSISTSVNAARRRMFWVMSHHSSDRRLRLSDFVAKPQAANETA